MTTATPMTRGAVVMMFRAMLTCPTLRRAVECAAEFCELIHPPGRPPVLVRGRHHRHF